MLGDPTVTMPTLLKIFILGTLAILLIVVGGLYAFFKWKKKDQSIAKEYRESPDKL